MSGVQIGQRAASDGQRGNRRGQEGWPTSLYRATLSTACAAVILSSVKGCGLLVVHVIVVYLIVFFLPVRVCFSSVTVKTMHNSLYFCNLKFVSL